MKISTDAIVNLLLSIPAILISLTAHEYSHAYAAYRQGDNTAKAFGRLSLNPLKHIDILGFVCLFVAHFGWAKPVPINPRNFKNYKKGIFKVSLAGPLSNLCLAFLGLVVWNGLALMITKFGLLYSPAANFISLFLEFLSIFVSINISLFVFNLLPLPPLDGSKIFGLFLPSKAQIWLMNNERYIQIVLIILLITGRLSGIIGTVGGYVGALLAFIARILFLPFG